MINWIKGRQDGGYLKKKIFVSKLLKMDMWLLKFPEGSFIPIHNDPMDGRHYRLNIYLKSAKKGGMFVSDENIISNRWFTLFRPDKSYHYVTRVEEGVRYVLSFGVVLRDER